ncbi:hypothetical protein GALMADRAFT_222602 [Galerina marginata CBS 339.88]|uniref:F-box domain-containing protein n=1 Tax=Galerina marginata (strain CBS 339.88) TaxID=685588 RepID=A0A067TM87_GALM3|nr:hypothetical protein GALMADRAFT_222602 [Galerina marginata CBS 339.88]
MDNPLAIALPPEIKDHILRFCSLSSLASLARVHTMYHVGAEREIYRAVTLSISETSTLTPGIDSKTSRCLDTLSTIPEKASLVHSLTVSFPRKVPWTSKTCAVPILLIKTLCHTHSLSDLRVHLNFEKRGMDAGLQMLISEVLMANKFYLHTLYCDLYIDIIGIIARQPRLKIIGVYGDPNFDLGEYGLLNIFRYLEKTRSIFPIIFGLQHEEIKDVTELDYTMLVRTFPVFYPNNPLLCRAVADSLNRDLDTSYHRSIDKAKVDEVTTFKVYLTDLSDILRVRDIVKDIGEYFPNIRILCFYLELERPVTHPKMKDILSFISKLATVAFNRWQCHNNVETALPREFKVAQVKEWASTCPHLLGVYFLDGFALRLNEEGLWQVRSWEGFNIIGNGPIV